MFSVQKHGLKLYLRNPNSYTPVKGSNDYLLLGSELSSNVREIAKFSKKDAEVSKQKQIIAISITTDTTM